VDVTVDLLELYRQLVLIRRFEERTIELRMEGIVHGVVHPYLGQEAVAVGVCSALRMEDRIVSTHRGHGHCIAKGADVGRMMAELFGRRDGYCRGKGGSMHIAAYDVGMLGANGIVGAGLPIATGAALAGRLKGDDTVAVGFFSEGATGEGTFHEALNLAALWQLPVVWVCENNGYASDTPLRESVPTGSVAAFAAGYGIPGHQVDGNDVLAVREATGEAVARARAGDGPTLLECRTLRGPTHALREVLPVDPRPADEVSGWLGGDPIERFEQVLRERAAADDARLAAVRAAVDADLEDAIERALASPFPAPEEALEDMFASG
jgi:TPP-dependent pyruvate/acetoin dehydrogenase alpha subunit